MNSIIRAHKNDFPNPAGALIHNNLDFPDEEPGDAHCVYLGLSKIQSQVPPRRVLQSFSYSSLVLTAPSQARIFSRVAAAIISLMHYPLIARCSNLHFDRKCP